MTGLRFLEPLILPGLSSARTETRIAQLHTMDKAAIRRLCILENKGIMKSTMNDLLTSVLTGPFKLSATTLSRYALVRDELVKHEIPEYTIDMAVVTDKASLLGEIVRAFTHSNETMQSWNSWDAVADLAWQRLMEHSHSFAVVVWKNADELRKHDLQLLLNCIEFFLGLARTVEEGNVGSKEDVRNLRIFVVEDSCSDYTQ